MPLGRARRHCCCADRFIDGRGPHHRVEAAPARFGRAPLLIFPVSGRRGRTSKHALAVHSNCPVVMTKPSVPTNEQVTEKHDRRSNPELRRLIEDMLERVRQMNRNVGVWSPEERARAEADLESVMARVRRLAAEGPSR